MATSVASALDWWARTKGDHDALIFADDVVSYRCLRDWSGRIARLLGERGVAPGDRVALLGGNSPEWTAAAYGVIKAGGVLIPVNPRLVAAEIHPLLTASGAAHVIADPAHDTTLKEVAELGSRFSVVDLPGLSELRDGGDDVFRIDREPHQAVAVLFTSGSTGMSKGVTCTNRTLLDIIFEASLTQDGLGPGARSLLVLPLCFTPGLVWGLIMFTVLGGTLVVEKELNPSRAVRLLAEHEVQVMFGVPLLYEVMSRAPEFADADLSNLASAVVGGAAVPVELLRTWAAKGVTLRQIYGMVEAGGIATATWPSEATEHPDKCGSGSIFTELKVVRDDGTECDPGEEGEILLRGPGVTPGYWRDPDITARTIRDGWLHSGDLGKRDDVGRLTFVDRLKDLIISGGINISPVEVESVISAIPGVAEVAVVAARDDRFGETPAAIVHPADDGLDEAAIIEECGRKMADYKVPRYVVIRPDPLPRLPNGKISKREVRAEYADITDRYRKVR